MSSVPCPTPGCSSVRPGHLVVCRGCSAALIRDLGAVPGLAVDLEITRARQGRAGEHIHAHGHGDVPLPWDQRAAQAAADLRSILSSWVWVLSDGAPIMHGPRCRACTHRSCAAISLARSPVDTLAGLSRWLVRHRSRLLAHRDVPKAVVGIGAAVDRARRAVDLPPDRIYVGPCTGCSRDLYAKRTAGSVVCRPCGLEYEVEPQREWMRDQIPGMIGNASWVATAAAGLGYDTSAAAIRGMADRGRIASRGRDARGYPVYLVQEVLEVIDEINRHKEPRKVNE